MPPLRQARTDSARSHRNRRQGFALLITITLLAFLVLLLVSLSSMTRVETQVTSNSQQIALARQNALFALNVALGQLQVAAGPDQRVTACAEVLPTTNAANAKWTGVWDSSITDLENGSTATSGFPSGNIAKPIWLVSQANTTTAPDPTAPITLPSGSYGNTTYVQMVGTGSVGSPAPANSTVVVPVTPITVAASSVPGLSGAANATVGRFGYWVGDEGVKARVNLPNPNATKTDTLSQLNQLGTAQSTAWDLFSGPTSPTPAATDPATVLTTTMMNAAGNMTAAGQIPLLSSKDSGAPAGAAAALSQLNTARFHDYTYYSSGVQSDVRNGGLKWDLSTAFDLSSANWANTEFSTYAPKIRDNTNTVISPIKSFATATTSESFVFLPQVAFPGNTTIPYLRGPTWSLLRSHAELYQTQNPTTGPTTLLARAVYPGGATAGLSVNSQNSIPSLYETNPLYPGAQTDPNSSLNTTNSPAVLVPRPIQTGVAPYINRILIRFGINTVSKGIVTTSAGDSDSVYAVRLVMTPIVVLHNPYDVPITLNSYSGGTSPGIGSTPNIAAQINLFAGTSRGLPLLLHLFVGGNDYMLNAANGGAGDGIISLGANSYNNGWPTLHLLIPATITLQPGEVKVLYPQLNNSDVVVGKGPPDTTYITLSTQPNLQGGFILPYLNGQAVTQQTDTAYPATANLSNTKVNPPILVAGVGGTVPPFPAGGALTAAEFLSAAGNSTTVGTAGPGNAAEIWCHASDNIQAVINTAGADFEIKYSIESANPGTGNWTTASPGTSTDKVVGNPNTASLAYQLDGFVPPYVKSGATTTGYDANLAQYTTPSTSSWACNTPMPTTALPASSCTTDKYFFALDYYVKPADQDLTRAARPFITSSPVAFEQFSTALGAQSPSPSVQANGFPHTMPAYQIDLLSLDPTSSSNLEANMYINTVGSTSYAIWGPHNGNDGQASSTLGGSAQGLSIIPLIHIPTRPLASIADLQHANIAFYGYQPYFAVGNSYASPYVPASSFANPVGYFSWPAAKPPYFLYDLSYLMNWSLWDKYFFSTLSQQWSGSAWNNTDAALQTTIKNWIAGNVTLPDTRMALRISPTANANDSLGNTTVTPIQAAYRKVAANLLTLGSFNINSRSVDAWAAVLGAARGLSVVTNPNGTGTPSAISMSGGATANGQTPIPRVLPAVNGQSDNQPLSSAAWTGFAALTDAQIRQLAANVVAEITRRQGTTGITTMTGIANPATVTYNQGTGGPFRSLADFVNRNLANDLTATNPTGAAGPLQAALDEGTNPNSPNYAFFNGSTFRNVSAAQGASGWAFNWNGVSNANAGAGPTSSTANGFMLQADVLQQIGPFLSARSDTFVIRTYGETVNPVTGATTGKTWCEAVVQRMPEYMDQTDPALSSTSSTSNGSLLGFPLGDATPPYSTSYTANNSLTGTVTTTALFNPTSNNQTYGRRFKIISFRWLTPSDL